MLTQAEFDRVTRTNRDWCVIDADVRYWIRVGGAEGFADAEEFEGFLAAVADGFRDPDFDRVWN